MDRGEKRPAEYRIMVRYLGHGEGGNATAWASTWQGDKDELLGMLGNSMLEISSSVASHLRLDAKDGSTICLPFDVLQRSVVTVERKEENGGESAALDGLTRYEASIAYGAAGGTDASCMVEDPDGEWVRLADVRALLNRGHEARPRAIPILRE